MFGLMQDRPLLISSIIEHAARHHGDTEIVSRTLEGPVHRYGYRDAHRRARQLANALTRLGVQQGDRVATLAWNGYRHFELYFAVSGMGAVLHTINPRLFPEQIRWIAEHAQDRVLCFDACFLPLIEQSSRWVQRKGLAGDSTWPLDDEPSLHKIVQRPHSSPVREAGRISQRGSGHQTAAKVVAQEMNEYAHLPITAFQRKC